MSLLNDLISEFLTKTHLQQGEISNIKLDTVGVRHAGKFNLEYDVVKEV